MSWWTVTAEGSTRDLWVHVTGEGAPKYGRWTTPAGLDVDRVLGEHGPDALDVKVWWIQQSEAYGERLTDFIWQTGLLGLKLVSGRMLEVLQSLRAEVEVFEVDIRLRNGTRVEGYVGMLEQCREPAPVHSLWRGRRSHGFVVSDEVRAGLQHANLTGLEIEPVEGPFPADRPGFSNDD